MFISLLDEECYGCIIGDEKKPKLEAALKVPFSYCSYIGYFVQTCTYTESWVDSVLFI